MAGIHVSSSRQEQDNRDSAGGCCIWSYLAEIWRRRARTPTNIWEQGPRRSQSGRNNGETVAGRSSTYGKRWRSSEELRCHLLKDYKALAHPYCLVRCDLHAIVSALRVLARQKNKRYLQTLLSTSPPASLLPQQEFQLFFVSATFPTP
ncbi:hypothetical protein HETIRDRAFT_420582 [Heterobasidion irregulare TC 32-1]|uniref:Uncharacterized protein n=1 Tax=Heterobasidion irregulare (strain TC 32-1) TaxID=747525 RepID=W4JXE5_HETIT|nr:uncharacterized protein HETIRDRAFT_420582 [Heterobasidion irregulare TC 32-1]ETW77745.1 hypothetical protein HETIRDRAFT_420582 [Heterobasidion irregulare TC 32-1]